MAGSSSRGRFKKLLVVNRGEIAIRILQAAHELPWLIETVALYTSTDETHCFLGRPNHAIKIPSIASYTDVRFILDLVKKHNIDAVHPGYGFLGENHNFARQLTDAGVIFVGPHWQVLERTGDKLQAKRLAETCNVPVLPALTEPTDEVQKVRDFAERNGYPVMIKAVDGGGGRGIRLARSHEDLEQAVKRAVGESPSRKVFVERAALDGFHHVEVQILGDHSGDAIHFFERDCSVQRRFQKIVECAPALFDDRKLVGKVIDGALKMAREISYTSLGTFEFLVNDATSEHFFLEINPRVQVEHTITEQVTGIDLVFNQLLIAQGHSIENLDIPRFATDAHPPPLRSIQLRVCAEDPQNQFSLSIGKITNFLIPEGNGVRIDTHCSSAYPVVVGSDTDNMIAKVIVTAHGWEQMISKAKRVLRNAQIEGVKTNIDLLFSILSNEDFMNRKVDTQWLEKQVQSLVEKSDDEPRQTNQSQTYEIPAPTSSTQSSVAAAAASSMLFRRGDAWQIDLSPVASSSNPGQRGSSSADAKKKHHLTLERVLRNEFPSSLTAEISYATASSSEKVTPQRYRLNMHATNTSAAASLSSKHRRGDPSNSRHVLVPMSGRLIEVLVRQGDTIREGDVVAFVRQMKMELEIRSPRAGKVGWALELEQEEDVAEGVLLAELEEDAEAKSKL